MAEQKYQHLIKRNPLSKENHIYPEVWSYIFHTEGARDWGGAPFIFGFYGIDKPCIMAKEAHTHDFDQFIMFLGANSLHIEDMDAEIELYLGPEQEKHVITCPSVVYIPKGTVHCPLNFKVVNKPVVLMDCMLTPSYTRKVIDVSKNSSH